MILDVFDHNGDVPFTCLQYSERVIRIKLYLHSVSVVTLKKYIITSTPDGGPGTCHSH